MADNFLNKSSKTVQIPAGSTLNSIIDGRVNSDGPLTLGTLNAQFNFVTASNFTVTANGTGDNITIGDDVKIGDVNVANTLGVKGIQDPTQGYIKFGSSGPVFGFSNTSGLFAAGTAVTGSLIQSGSSLYFYNGTSGTAGNVKGWATVI
jgi:hypothetical protein